MLLTGLLLALLLGLAAQKLCTRIQYDLHNIPPAPGALPFIGHLHVYWRRKNFTQSFLDMHNLTTKPVLRVFLPHKLFLIVADPGIAADVLARYGPGSVPRKLPEYAAFDAATGLHGHHSILTEQDESMWLAVRKALSPAYTPAAVRANYLAVLKSYGDVAHRISASICTSSSRSIAIPHGAKPSKVGQSKPAIHMLAVASSGEVPAVLPGLGQDVQVDHHLLAAAVQTQVEGLFGMAPGQIDYLQAAHDLETAISIVHNHPAQPWLAVLHRWIPWATAAGWQLREARLRLANTCYEPIMRHVETCACPSDLSLTACLRRLIDPRTGKAPPRERLLAEVGNQIMAPETAAHTISWVLYCLATHPEAEMQLLKELKGAGMPCNGNIQAATEVLAARFDPLKGLAYLDAVISEAMRLYPAGASASPRQTEKPTMVGPYRVPAGVVVFPSLFVVNNYSGSWGADAREFKPERWQAADAAIDSVTGAPRFLPFSAGPKNCIGLALGQVAVRTAVALLLSNFSFKPAACMGKHEDVMASTMLALTLKVEGGMWLTATQRTG
eukprot:GHRR01010527.1.p1 GENE.GHRR01010527.1~~GHRR01010527.1.p1  ORF type:complete len:556 (+),score=158.24 GHRR01010527.1:303-1970(+)